MNGWVLLILIISVFSIGILMQRAGIPGRIRKLLLDSTKGGTELDGVYSPIAQISEVEGTHKPTVWVRKLPYPFKAALSIASDIDYCTVEIFEEIHRFLNTDEMTSMGPGLNLDIADSMWMYDIAAVRTSASMPPSMSYWKGITPGQIQDAGYIQEFVNNGWIDSLHTYGNFSSAEGAFRRELAAAALEELSAKGIFLDTWIDHGDSSNAQNFAQYHSYSYQQGDNPHSQAYHTDLLSAYGIRYAWGPERLEFGTDQVAVPLQLRDGQRIWQFNRYSGDGGGSHSSNWFPNRIHRQLTENHLTKLLQNNQWEIVANHLGAGTPPGEKFVPTHPPLGAEACQALRLLAYEFRRGNIMVLRTSRLLKYYVVSKYINWNYDSDSNRILLNSVDDPVFGHYVPTLADLRGLTFYVSNPLCLRIVLDSKQIDGDHLVWNAHDGTAESVTIWPYYRYL